MPLGCHWATSLHDCKLLPSAIHPSSVQAMADYATLIWSLREELNDPDAPVIGLGGYALGQGRPQLCGMLLLMSCRGVVLPRPGLPQPLSLEQPANHGAACRSGVADMSLL